MGKAATNNGNCSNKIQVCSSKKMEAELEIMGTVTRKNGENSENKLEMQGKLIKNKTLNDQKKQRQIIGNSGMKFRFTAINKGKRSNR